MIPYIRIHALTVPGFYPPNTWLAWGTQGDCSQGQGCRDVPAGTFDFERLRPYLIIASVEVIGTANIDETVRGCANDGWKKYVAPAFTSELECVFNFSTAHVFLPVIHS